MQPDLRSEIDSHILNLKMQLSDSIQVGASYDYVMERKEGDEYSWRALRHSCYFPMVHDRALIPIVSPQPSYQTEKSVS